jgi:hypothetical protein
MESSNRTIVDVINIAWKNHHTFLLYEDMNHLVSCRMRFLSNGMCMDPHGPNS